MGTSSAISSAAGSSPGRRSARFAAALLLAAAPLAPAPFDPALDTAVEAAGRVAPELGVHVVDVASGEVFYSLHADEPRIVASNIKLVTTAAALELLGPGYFFETWLQVRGWMIGDALVGDLGVQGAGDPNISGRHHDGDPLSVFRRWAARLRELGVREVTGNLYLANGLFDAARIHPDWPRDQLGKWYEAPVDALSFSDNCLLVRVLPGRAAGLPARVETVPDLEVLEVRNLARTTSSRSRHQVSVYRPPDARHVVVSGSIYSHAAPVEVWVTVPEPAFYFGAALRKAFADEGVEIRGRIETGAHLPEGAWRRLAVHRSDLLTTLEVTNRRSQNFYAESVLKTLGAAVCGRGDWEAGRSVLRDFLARLGIPSGGYELADGSGLSRNNRFTPRQMTLLLTHMYHHQRGPEFLGTLPESGGEDGRWKERLAGDPYRGNVLAKTGTLRAVSALSGYARARSGRVYAFSILCNRITSDWEARRAQDRIVRAVVDRG